MNKKISVVIPTFNRERFLKEALDSVLCQSLENAEVIVVDDGSTDGTADIVCAYADRFKEKDFIRYIPQRNQGPSHARNTGIRNARGQYITFLDVDDIWVPDTLNERIRFLDEHPDVALVFSDMIQFRGEEVLSSSYFREKKGYDDLVREADHLHNAFALLLRENFVPLPTVVVRQSCLRQVGLFDEDLSCAEDLDLWLRISSQCPIACLPTISLRRRVHEENISFNWFATASCNIAVLNKVKTYAPQLFRKHHRQIRRKLAIFHQAVGYLHFEKKEFNLARSHMARSLLNKPTCRSTKYFFLAALGPRAVHQLRSLRGH